MLNHTRIFCVKKSTKP